MSVDRDLLHLVQRATPETLSVTFYADGEVADPGVTTVTVTNAAGTALYTDQATSGTGENPRTFTLTKTDTASVDLLTVVFTSANYGAQTLYVEIVGEHLFTLAEARAHDNAALSDGNEYATADLEIGRLRILDEFERICGVAFVPRYKRVVLDGSGTTQLILPDLRILTVRSIETRERGSQTWTAYTADELADVQVTSSGLLINEGGTFTSGTQNIRVSYEYGHSRCPEPIRRAALILLRDQIVPSNLPDRATSQSNELGTFALSTAGLRGAWFGIPAVDSTLDRYRERIPGMAY